MPLYEYQCAGCGERIELLRGFNQPPLTECPQCGGALTKLISAPAIQFKGSGFYLTDYGRGGGSPKTDAAAGKSDGAAEANSGTRDNAPAQDGKAAPGEKPNSGNQPANGGKPSADTKPAASPASPAKKAG